MTLPHNMHPEEPSLHRGSAVANPEYTRSFRGKKASVVAIKVFIYLWRRSNFQNESFRLPAAQV